MTLEEYLLNNMDKEKLYQFVINMRQMKLNKLSYIKRYNKLRRIHGEIVDSMLDYIQNGKYDINEEIKDLSKTNEKTKIKELNMVNLDLNNPDDITIFTELFVYPNESELKSVTEIYLEKNKFRNKEKIEMLEAMKNSFVSLFKIVKIDEEKGYVYYEDVFTRKRYRILDIAMSTTTKINPKRYMYSYNRIIKIDDEISFTTGIHCFMTSDNKKLMEYIRKTKTKKHTINMCLKLYKISKQENKFKIAYKNQY